MNTYNLWLCFPVHVQMRYAHAMCFWYYVIMAREMGFYRG